MSLDAGTRLGPYEIQSAIGAGGMGDPVCTDHELPAARFRDLRLGAMREFHPRNSNCSNHEGHKVARRLVAAPWRPRLQMWRQML